MRIAYMLTSLGIGGAERQVISLAERMAARGHSVALVVLRSRQLEEWPTTLEVAYLEMRKTPLSVCAGLLRGRRFLSGFHPDIVHSHTYPANMAARVLRLFCASPVVLSTIHNVYEGDWPRMFAYRATDFLSRHTTTVCAATANRYVCLKAVPSHKCSVINNGIDTEEFVPNVERRAHTRAQFSAADEFIWLAVGRIIPAKDFPNLLRAFAQVHAAFPDAQLWIAGEATDLARQQFEGLAVELGLRDRVRWLRLCRDMPAVLDAADGFVLASAWEGMPLAIGEAMAMQKPVVATDVGGVLELVGDAGSLVPAKDAAALAAAMLNVIRMPLEERHAMGRAARKRIEESFSFDTKADEWEALYHSVLARH